MKEWIDTGVSVRTDPQKLLLGLGLLPLVGIAVFGVSALAYGARGWQLPMLGLGISTALLFTVPAILDRARPPSRRHLMLTLISLAHGIYFVAPVFTKYLLEDPRATVIDVSVGDVLPRSLLTAQLAVFVGFLVMLASYALPVGRSVARLFPEPRHEWSDRTAIGVALIGLPVGWIVYLASFFGLISAMAGTAAFDLLAQFPITAIILLGVVYMRSRSRSALLLMLVLIPITMFFGFFSGSKGRFLEPLIMLGLAYVVVERRVRMSWVLAGFVAVVLFYPAAEFYRNVLTEGRGAADMVRDPAGVLRNIAEFAAGYGAREWLVDGLSATLLRFDGLGILALIMQTTPEHVPYQGGWTIGYIFLFWIPRAIWEGKPDITIGQWIQKTYTIGAGATETSVGCTWFGEFYLNFGWLGIVFGMILLGVVFRVLHEVLFTRRPILPSIVAGTLMINLTARGLGGSLLGFTGIFWALAPLVVLHGSVRLLGATVPRPSAGQARLRQPSLAADPPKSTASA